MYFLRLFFLVFIFGFSNVDFLKKGVSETIFDDIVNTTKASQSYFNDIGHWPASVVQLINTNYLKYHPKNISLFNKNGQLSIALEANNVGLNKYFLNYKVDETTGRILIPVKKGSSKGLFGVCSNLYCPSY